MEEAATQHTLRAQGQVNALAVDLCAAALSTLLLTLAASVLSLTHTEIHILYLKGKGRTRDLLPSLPVVDVIYGAGRSCPLADGPRPDSFFP